MKTLTIKDLARTEELDSNAMAAVRGGWKTMPSSSYSMKPMKPSYPGSTGGTGGSGGDSSIHGTQELQQYQDIVNATANDSAFLDNVKVTNQTSQFGQNNFVVYR
ncbi:MAG: hypothetical protein ACJ8LG_10245 [Massilia sp.]